MTDATWRLVFAANRYAGPTSWPRCGGGYARLRDELRAAADDLDAAPATRSDGSPDPFTPPQPPCIIGDFSAGEFDDTDTRAA